MADDFRLIGPVAVTNLTAAAGVTTTDDGWWPCLDITWRTPVPPTVTRLVAQVRERGTDGKTGPIAETVVTPGDGVAKIVNGVSVGQHLEVRLAAAGAPGLRFKATPWLEVTTPWDALMAALDGLKVGCVRIVCGVGEPTRTDLPIGSLYIEEAEGQLWQYAGSGSLGTLSLTNGDFETGDMTGWTVSHASVVAYTAPRPAGDDNPHGGSWAARAGTVTPTTFYQDVDVSAYAAEIDSGAVTLNGFAAWHATYDSQSDHGRLEATFLDNVGATISQATTAYTHPNAWTREELVPAAVPAGTRTIRLGVQNVRSLGVNNDNYWDDFEDPTLALNTGWVLKSDLTSIRSNGVEIEDSPRSLDVVDPAGVLEATADASGNVTLTLHTDTDTTLAADSDARVATQKAIKAYVDALLGGTSYTDEMAQDAVAAMLAAGAGISLNYDDASNTLTISVSFASTGDLNTGTNTTKAINSDVLAGSDFGVSTYQVDVTDPNGSDITIGDGKAYFRIRAEDNGRNLDSVALTVTTVSSSGIVRAQLHNMRSGSDMLSTRVSVDASENDSSTAATPPVIDAANDDVQTGDLIRIDIDDAGTGAKGAIVTASFRKP